MPPFGWYFDVSTASLYHSGGPLSIDRKSPPWTAHGGLCYAVFSFFWGAISRQSYYYIIKTRRGVPPDGVRLGARVPGCQIIFVLSGKCLLFTGGQLLAKKTRRTVHKDRARPAWGPGCGFCVLGGWPCGVARNPGLCPGYPPCGWGEHREPRPQGGQFGQRPGFYLPPWAPHGGGPRGPRPGRPGKKLTVSSI